MADEVEEAVAAAATSLYAVPLGEFVASRKALAATAKSSAGPAAAKEVLALRKPTVTAWAMNLTSREDPEVVRDLVGLGARMRAAQSRLDAGTLRSVRGERDATVAAYVDRVAEVATAAGAALSASGHDEVRASAIAALADESAAEALCSGQLTRALSYSGFGEVDLSGAVGVTSSGSIMSVLPGGAGAPGASGDSGAAGEAERREGEGQDDEDDEDDDELTAEELARAVAEAKAAKAAAKARRRAEAEVEAAQAQMRQAQAELEAAEDAARVARKAVVAAQKRLDAARADVSGLP
ncbi:hypothetical protein ACOCJ4_07930 [Knoellia sp. CPCC 206435]|uniref:hypothetical protein n=1 Tax=Knoellia terrae TaxID=3404797 RepID=UPI003B4333E4